MTRFERLPPRPSFKRQSIERLTISVNALGTGAEAALHQSIKRCAEVAITLGIRLR